MIYKIKSLITIIIIIYSFFYITSNAIANDDEKIVISKLIEQKKFQEAKNKINEYLNKNPKNVNAIMMMGNVILNEHIMSNDFVSLEVNSNESIYDTTIATMGTPIKVISKDLASQVAKYWLKCLSIDNKRADIHKGLCYLYSMALMKDELLNHLPKMKSALANNKNLMYVMGHYARMFDERRDFVSCIDIYKKIISLYPNSSGIYSDLAAINFNKGKISEAERYFSIAIKKENPDTLVYNNIILVKSLLGQYDEVLETQKLLSKHENNNNWLLYEGLLLYYRKNNRWKIVLKNFLSKNKDKKSYERELAKYLISKRNRHKFNNYIESFKTKPSVPYLILLHKTAMRRFTKKFDSMFNYSELLTYYKLYDAAIKSFKIIETKRIKMNKIQREGFYFYYAWSLQQLNMKIDANYRWKKLLTSKNFFKKSAAAYFLGKNLLEEGKKKEAINLFKMISQKPSESKYATYCWNLLKTIK